MVEELAEKGRTCENTGIYGVQYFFLFSFVCFLGQIEEVQTILKDLEESFSEFLSHSRSSLAATRRKNLNTKTSKKRKLVAASVIGLNSRMKSRRPMQLQSNNVSVVDFFQRKHRHQPPAQTYLFKYVNFIHYRHCAIDV